MVPKNDVFYMIFQKFHGASAPKGPSLHGHTHMCYTFGYVTMAVVIHNIIKGS